ncbi:probable inactive poly [ADP-ribose] polymerase SRO5 [Nicotiana sylvestris]|uniref:Probable inactive poly [ADP-ribose] polymerase SRO5 n=1 Tax=Nicotiana sylvestris TaxID=4096 RepID=A0A1U7XT44_NICSY|nr:PREDICTED: probable inactive poly [ADP-ribose] polymerase SRO5 [Nicotiana sylvestris]
MKNILQHQPQLLSLFPVEAIQDAYPNRYKIYAPSNMGKAKAEHNSEHHLMESTNSGSDHNDDIQESAVSDSESGIFGSNYQENAQSDDLIRIDEGDKMHQIINKKFISGLGILGLSTQIEAIDKNAYSSFTMQARLQSFLRFSKAMEKKCGGNANEKYAWFGASKDDIDSIFSHGFGNPMNNGAYGHCICLSPYDYPLDCLQTAIPDKDGLRHLLLSRVILGRLEVVHPGLGQSHPTSEQFDTGVDNLHSPRKYIVWSSNMNAYIFPDFVISFRIISKVKESRIFSVPLKSPSSAWISFPALISALSKILPPNTVKLIKKYHSDYKERKITRRGLIQQATKLAGDELLALIIKSCKTKQNKGSTADSPRSSSINLQQWDNETYPLPKQDSI